jgi:hypothetical protein
MTVENTAIVKEVTGVPQGGLMGLYSKGGQNFLWSGTQAIADSKAPFSIGSYNNSTEWIRIDTAGYLGVGTSSPTRRLDVWGSYQFTHNPITELTPSGGYGDIVTFGSGTVATFSTYAFQSTSVWGQTDADYATGSTGLIAIALANSVSRGMLLRGYVENISWNWTVGGAIYLSTSPSTLTQTAPTALNDYIRIVGYAIATQSIYFCPDNTWVLI